MRILPQTVMKLLPNTNSTIVILVVVLVFGFFYFVPVGLWITALFSGVKVKISNLIGMKLRRVRASKIIIH